MFGIEVIMSVTPAGHTLSTALDYGTFTATLRSTFIFLRGKARMVVQIVGWCRFINMRFLRLRQIPIFQNIDLIFIIYVDCSITEVVYFEQQQNVDKLLLQL